MPDPTTPVPSAPKPQTVKEDPLGKPVQVRATAQGFYDGCRVRAGTVFMLAAGLRPGRWMERASDGAVWDKTACAWGPRKKSDKKAGRANWWEPHRPAKTQAQLDAESNRKGQVLRDLSGSTG